MLELLATVGTSRAQEAGLDLPDRRSLPTAAEWAELIAHRATVGDASARAKSGLRPGAIHTEDQEESLRPLAVDVRREADWRRSVANTWVGRVLDQHGDPRMAGEWAGFVHSVADLARQVFDLRPSVRAHDVRVPNPVEPGLEGHLRDAVARFTADGKLGVFARDAKRAVEQCSVDGVPPRSADAAQLCVDALVIERLRHRIAVQWHNQTTPVGGPPLNGLPEEALASELDLITACRDAQQRWTELRRRLDDHGVVAPPRPDATALMALAGSVEDAVALAQLVGIEQRLRDLHRHLQDGAGGPRASPLWGRFIAAATALDNQAWSAALTELGDLERIIEPARRLGTLLSRLAAVAPAWAGQITRDPGGFAAEDLPAVWQWRQLDTWLRSIAELPSPATLQGQLEGLGRDRRRAVTGLVAEQAWRRMLENLGHRQQRALQAYVAAVNRFGKTGGKYASRWITEMREALEEATTAVPVWIMPVSRALTNFRPAASPPFDVLIVDEASQIGFEALPLLALARSTIIVGDDRQTSPENVGLDRERVFDLMDGYLRDIPRYKTVFDPDKSLYDLALLRFASPVMLTEHFRSLPPIIEFSNRHAYDGKIIPLRDRPPRPGWEPLRVEKVEGGFRRGFVNEREADAVVGLLERLHRDADYVGMTFGVVTLLGTAQSKLVRDRLYDRLGPEAIERRALRVGEAANFQGDERDVMVLSTVIAAESDNPSGRFGSMTSAADLRRINVAASRARNQMWIVTSVSAQDLSPGDLRAALLKHCSEASTTDDVRSDPVERCRSEFERRVVAALLERGYQDVAAQHEVGRYSIDIVVTGPESRLAIECDGDSWDGDDAWERDRARQEVLTRAGWTFERIRGSSFFRNQDAAMQPLWDRLEQLGIPTGDWREERARTASVEDTAPQSGAVPRSSGRVDIESPVDPKPSEMSLGTGLRAVSSTGVGATFPTTAEEALIAELPIFPEVAVATEEPALAWSPPAWYAALTATTPEEAVIDPPELEASVDTVAHRASTDESPTAEPPVLPDLPRNTPELQPSWSPPAWYAALPPTSLTEQPSASGNAEMPPLVTAVPTASPASGPAAPPAAPEPLGTPPEPTTARGADPQPTPTPPFSYAPVRLRTPQDLSVASPGGKTSFEPTTAPAATAQTALDGGPTPPPVSDDGAERLRPLPIALPAQEAAELGVPMAPGRISKAPYTEWPDRPLAPASLANLKAVIAGLVEIVEAEGPMHADRAYRLYVVASGGHRVGKEIRGALNTAVDGAVRRGLLRRLHDGFTRTPDATLFPPTRDAVVMRERGPRELYDIPRGEIRKLMIELDTELSTDELKRAVLREWGLGRLTGRADLYLETCLEYVWR